MAAEKGMSVFLDIFRRADKNDDGAISWEEFLSFFSDGVMGKEELKDLFNEIDTHNTNNIDTGELCAYFSKNLGTFKDVYAILEELNSKMTKVLFSTSQTYQQSSRKDQFVNRFLLHEILNQFSAIQHPLEHASDVLDEQARQENDIIPVQLDQPNKKTMQGGVVPGRVARRAKRQSSSNSLSAEGVSVNLSLSAQVERLASLVDRLENQINFDGFIDEEINIEDEEKYVLHQKIFMVNPDAREDFKAVMRDYMEALGKASGSSNSCVQSFKNTGKIVLYEIWSSESDIAAFAKTQAAKDFVKGIRDLLDDDVEIQSMIIPGHWWQKNY